MAYDGLTPASSFLMIRAIERSHYGKGQKEGKEG